MHDASALAENAFKDVCTSFNPRKTSVEDIEKLYVALYEGEKIDRVSSSLFLKTSWKHPC